MKCCYSVSLWNLNHRFYAVGSLSERLSLRLGLNLLCVTLFLSPVQEICVISLFNMLHKRPRRPVLSLSNLFKEILWSGGNVQSETQVGGCCKGGSFVVDLKKRGTVYFGGCFSKKVRVLGHGEGVNPQSRVAWRQRGPTAFQLERSMMEDEPSAWKPLLLPLRFNSVWLQVPNIAPAFCCSDPGDGWRLTLCNYAEESPSARQSF